MQCLGVDGGIVGCSVEEGGNVEIRKDYDSRTSAVSFESSYVRGFAHTGVCMYTSH